MLALRDYQAECVKDLRAQYAAGSHAPLLVLPTGGGKTVVFTYMATRAAEKGNRVLLLGHRRELIGQMSAALGRWDCPHGVISPDAKVCSAPVQVGMVQTIANRIALDKAGRYKFDLVIIDEAHHATKNSTWGRVLQHNVGAKLLGVSATPCRLDGKGLGVHADGFFDSMVIGPTMPELIELGNLVRPVVYAPAQSIDLTGVKKSRGDYAIGALAGAVDRAPITGNAIKEYQQHADRRSAIAFTVTVEHAEHVVAQFKAAGYAAAVLTGSTPDKERARMLRDLGTGQLHVLASCNVVSEGTDIPAVFAALLLRPTESYALAMQQIGRALRPSQGKDRAIILDHADNVRRHGLPTDEVDWSLDGLQRKKGKNTKAPTKICTGCRAHVGLRVRVCPECGTAVNGDVEGGAARTNQIIERDGVLVEMSPEMLAARRKQRGQELKNARTKRDLVQLGRDRKYKNPEFWADKILEDRKQWAASRGVR
jgi:superfamily II DNA or RNA helicase